MKRIERKTTANELMLFARYKNLIIALLMMTFVGQSVASVSLSCQNPATQSQLHEQTMDAAGMDHSQHAGMNSSAGSDSSECCPECDCSLGSCFTAVLPASQHAFAFNPATLTSRFVSPAENQLTASLFRPPISR